VKSQLGEVRRIHLLRTPVNKGKMKGRNCLLAPALTRSAALAYAAIFPTTSSLLRSSSTKKPSGSIGNTILESLPELYLLAISNALSMLSACTDTLNLAAPLLTSMEILIMLFDVPLLIYVGLRTPGVPQSRNSGSPAHSLTECARRNTQFGPIPHPDRSRSAGGVVIFRWVVCLLCTPSREVHKKTYCIGPELCSILRPNVAEL
jgi:hypothetical protein